VTSRGARLGSDDVRAVLDAVRVMNDVATADEFAPRAMGVVGLLVRSDVTTFNEVDPVDGRVVALTDPPDFDLRALEPVLARLASDHPLIGHYLETGDGSARKISDFLSTAAFHESVLYREVYCHLGVEYQMSITLPAVMPHIVALVVNRGAGADFDDHDRAVLDLVRPHLAQAYRLARERQRLHALAGTASEALVASGAHAVILEDPPRELTPGALVMLYRYFGRPGTTDALPPRVVQWLAKQHGSRGGADLQPLRLLRPLVAERDGRQAFMRLLPQAPLDALLISDRPKPASPGDFERLGLSPREAQVVALLTTGASNAAIAERLHLSPATVKKHLENVYRKLGVHGRGSAVAAALDVLAGDIR
jgi:DNA-binding CsgD family transcriptional regulator